MNQQNMRHSGAILDMVINVSIPSFNSMPWCYGHFLSILHNFLNYPCNLSMEYFESHSFTVSILGVIASLVFLIVPWFPQYFSLCVKWNTFFIRISLPLFHGFIKGWFVSILLKISTILFSHRKSKNLVSSAS